MKTENRQFDKRRGSALLLVVVITVLLAVIGVMFLMVSRAGEAESGAVSQSNDLDSAVQTVVSRISNVLTEDLFGQNDRIVSADSTNPDADEPWDYASHGTTIGRMDDAWLCSLEPIFEPVAGYSSLKCVWPHISDLWDSFTVSNAQKLTVFDPGNPMGSLWMPENPSTISLYLQADADGDGVSDSRWVQIPNLTTSRGEPVFTAVRIIDNCAMLNLNAASCFDVLGYSDAQKKSPYEEVWKYYDSALTQQVWHSNVGAGTGRYLTEINYLPFLRGRDLNGNFFLGSSGGDHWYNLMVAKGLYRLSGTVKIPALPQASHQKLMAVENPAACSFFDIGDELELRNRYLVTSSTEARFERSDIANFTLDSGSTDYAALQVPRDLTDNPISLWYERLDPANFDKWDMYGNPALSNIPYKYDRRHISTFYSFDRPIRKGTYPLLESEIAFLPPVSRELIRGVLIPKGAVTTNIAVYDTATNSYNWNINETRKRILQLLYALREYFYLQNGNKLNAAALSAAQTVANIIDFSDNTGANGPFSSAAYGSQQDENCTFINSQTVTQLLANAGLTGLNFGLSATDVVFGYERQPFITEVYAQWNGSGFPRLQGFAIELINPYSTNMNLTGWRLQIGTTVNYQFKSTDPVLTANTRLIIRTDLNFGSGNTVPVEAGALAMQLNSLSSLETLFPNGDFALKLTRPAPVNSGISEISVDYAAGTSVRSLLGTDGRHSIQRDDDDWKFVYGNFAPVLTISTIPYNLGTSNSVSITADSLQLPVPNSSLPLERWHELETIAVQGNGSANDPNSPITYKLEQSSNVKQFDLTGSSARVLNYLCTMNRPELGSLPGRININTAPVHVIAAAIPPTLADPNAADPSKIVKVSALQLAQAIVNGRSSGPYTNVSDLLDRSGISSLMKQYWQGGELADVNVGSQSIDNDIEERDWILSNLANKFTVRSDTFTAYILVRVGTSQNTTTGVYQGPERRMIAIFDRSQVWTKDDRPKLVALHPVPDPR